MQRPTRGREQLQEFGRRVREARVALTTPDGRPASPERLAEMTGLHRTYIGHVERGDVNLALVNVLRIADALQVDPGDLVAGLTAPDLSP